VELRRLRLAIEASGEIVFTTDANGTFTYVNPEFERAYGYESSEIVGCCTPRILKSDSTIPAEYASFWALLKDNHIVKREFLNRTKQGALLHIETSANPIVDATEQVIGFLAVQRDVTERKRMEAALRESERRYRTLADAAHDSIFIINRRRQIEYHNDVHAKRFGLSSSNTIGKQLTDVFSGDTAGQIERQISVVFSTGQRQLFEERFTSAQGELWLETWLVPMLTDDSEVRAVMGVARDVTVRKALEGQLLQSQKMEAVGRLAGGIAHDFNNLLTAILGYSEILRDRLCDAPDVLADVDEIKKAGERASRLTRQLLAFSRKQPMSRQIVDVSALVADVHKMLGRMLGEHIELSVVAGRDVCQVIADPGQIEQVVVNLSVNARDAMPKGGRLTIATDIAQLDDAFVRRHVGANAGSYVSLSVQDTGCGMTPAVLAHVFEPFFTTKPQGQGTGLGLATVYGIVKQNAGYVAIDSRPDEGTTVTIFWPMPANDRNASVSQATSLPHPVGGSETILLVEDEQPIRALMRKTLERYGYRVLEAQDVQDALALGARYPRDVDLLLSDVIMPGLNGPDLAQRIVAQRPGLRVLYVSGFPNSLLSEHDRNRHRMAFLAKPFTPEALAMKVRECLDS